jgi:hypothetical protein
MILDFVNGGELFYHLKKEGKFDEVCQIISYIDRKRINGCVMVSK